MTIKISKTFITVNGKRAGIWIDNGPWIEGIPAEQIKIRCKRGLFPIEIRAGLEVTNGSDMMEDYFENDAITLMPEHELYAAAKQAMA